MRKEILCITKYTNVHVRWELVVVTSLYLCQFGVTCIMLTQLLRAVQQTDEHQTLGPTGAAFGLIARLGLVFLEYISHGKIHEFSTCCVTFKQNVFTL